MASKSLQELEAERVRAYTTACVAYGKRLANSSAGPAAPWDKPLSHHAHTCAYAAVKLANATMDSHNARAWKGESEYWSAVETRHKEEGL